jgi:hypothetical protein
MKLCEFCDNVRPSGECRLDLTIPKRMSCRSFEPRLGHFCADPARSVNAREIVRMATFFDIKGAELEKIRMMATREERELLESKV